MPATLKNVEASGDFKVADMSLADFGRKELDLAEYEMPGLMSARAEFGPAQPLAGALPGTLEPHTAAWLVRLRRHFCPARLAPACAGTTDR